ncbi:stage II sporulation protein R [Paenibacillus oenotherae]|uniref:Stage II sporulation protein R n=1 Tax=Paenibacillus oenotherae TaxID=1435645 RepID=A0ABS7D577_9BACL|nr:stage II sporulation protein R [Paenibacillus oenotherae]MBW7475097.1 stage II sporulation protein R [Paenibacillus oenotherae]
MIRTYSRFPYRSSYGYLFLALIMLLLSWESQKADAAIAGGDIPQESIRLRILANSDSAADQAVKRQVRDAVVAEINSWIETSGTQTIEEARQSIRGHMKDIEGVVAAELRERGFTYSFKAELDIVPFPTKIYGSKVYPAGNYEALRITLGNGAGENWWCVLFPPLCFVDAVSGEASAAGSDQAAEAAKAEQKTETNQVSETVHSTVVDSIAAAAAGQAETAAIGAEEAPEVKFFLWEMLESLWGFLSGLFS